MKVATVVLVCGLLVVLNLSSGAIYTDTYAVHITGGPEKAQLLVEKHGFTYLGQIMPDFYHVKHKHVAKRSTDPSFHHETLIKEEEVKWLEQQTVKRRVKRDTMFNDPKWARMWYLRRGNGLDMNVKPAWKKGYTGKGVVVSILDDGIEKDHPDLKKNYDPRASTDINGHDADPQPRYDYTNENRHGTRCAGEVAAEANNGICSVGVAYDASIGGVRMLDGDVTDAVESMSLSHNQQHIDVYSASWGPDDDGRTVDGPGYLAKQAFYNGITSGRRGLGSIFVWASGNGGRDGDSCNCDGYTNSIYTLSISSATENGHVPWYSEACSSTLATTYSSGSGGERQIVTTDLRKSCTEGHTGTSASAPLAAGICALALQANPHLTWRDLQHIVVQTARPENLRADDWVTNGVGRKVSHHFGYGLMDASAMVDLALNWTSVPPQRKCEIVWKGSTKKISPLGSARVYVDSDGCLGDPLHNVVYVEHVAAHITLSASRRGQIQIYLTSPAGTKSTLLQQRTRDNSVDGFNNWAFMTTHNWGEISRGTWTLEVENKQSSSELTAWSLVIHGTATNPQSGPQRRPRPPGEDKDCDDDEFILENFCYKECPMNYFPSHNSTVVPSTQNTTLSHPQSFANVNNTNSSLDRNTCVRCNFICVDCFGPNSNQCFGCAENYVLDNHTCRSRVGQYQDGRVHKNSFIIIAVIGCVLASVVFLVIFGILQCVDSVNICDCSSDCCRDSDKDDNSSVRYAKQEQALLDSESEEDDAMDVKIETSDILQPNYL